MAFTLETYALTQVNDVKSILDIASATTTWDQTFIELINSATLWIENYCGGRRLGNTTVPTYTQETYDGPEFEDEKSNWLYLDNFPVTAFTTIEYRTGTSSYATFDSSAYETYADRGAIYFHGGVPRGRKAVRVTYSAGYKIDWTTQANHTLPHDLTLACRLLVAQMFNKRKSQGIQSEKIGTWALSYETPEDSAMSDQIKDILARYRRVFV